LMNHGPVNSSTFIRKQCDEFTEQYLAIQRERMPNHRRYTGQKGQALNAVSQIRRIKDLAGQTPVVVALLPDENQVNPALQKRILPGDEISEYDFKMPQSMLNEMFQEIGIPTIDLLPAVLADHRCLYMNDTHWTPEGQKLAATVIFRELTPILAGMKAFN